MELLQELQEHRDVQLKALERKLQRIKRQDEARFAMLSKSLEGFKVALETNLGKIESMVNRGLDTERARELFIYLVDLYCEELVRKPKTRSSK